MKQKFCLVAILCISCMQLLAQEPCKVLKPEIAEKYEGKCKNGLAHGNGSAEGKDRYEGNFKNGLPHGKGKYTWSTGEVYEGKWKDGKKDGEGKYFYKKNGADSIKFGIWKEDVFFRKIVPNPYRIIRSYGVSRYSVQRISSGDKVFVSFLQNGITDCNVSNLLFTTSSGTSHNVGARQGFENVVFPFTIKIAYKTLNAMRTIVLDIYFEVEVKEPGTWEITLGTN